MWAATPVLFVDRMRLGDSKTHAASESLGDAWLTLADSARAGVIACPGGTLNLRRHTGEFDSFVRVACCCARRSRWHGACSSGLVHTTAAPRCRPLVLQKAKTLALSVCCLLGGCTAPVVYPRSADLLDAGRGRLRVAGNFVGIATTSARVESESGASDTFSDLSASRARSNFPDLDWLFGPVLSLEGGVDLSLGLCEVGGLLSLLRVGAELRCGLLQEDRGAPFSVAASGAYLYPVDVGDLYSMKDRGGFRAGIDSSFRIGNWGPLIGAYVDHGTQRRVLMDSNLPKPDSLFGNQAGEIVALRDEWRLAVPLGATFYGPRGGASIALLTEYTLSARDREAPELTSWDSTGNPVTHFEQHWALFLTASAEFTL
jgi:hypothetical protein